MSTYLKEASILSMVAAADWKAGDLTTHSTGLVGQVVVDVASGEMASVRVEGVVEVVNSGVVFAAGALVGIDAQGEAVATTTGVFDAGAAELGAGATDPVRVVLNAGL